VLFRNTQEKAMDGAGVTTEWTLDAPRSPALRAGRVDVAIIGAGLAGAILALVLARRGVSVGVVDLHNTHRSDFRCEKLSPAQLALLDDLGVREVVAGAVEGSLASSGFRYDAVVNAVRAAWPSTVRFVAARVSGLEYGEQGPRLMSSDGALMGARLVVLASGPGPALAARLGLEREVLRAAHSLCVGFTVALADGTPALEGFVHPGERVGDRIGFASLFPLGDAARINLFTFHDPRDPWVQRARQNPLEALFEVAPKARQRLAGVRLVEPAEVRFTDLYRTVNPARPGLVLIGDAFQTSCPSTGLGVSRLLTDIRQLVDRHLPTWLEAPLVDAAQIQAFYADPVKAAVDAQALQKADIVRRVAVETSPRWRAYRVASRLKGRLAARATTATVPHPPVERYAVGDWVRVKTASEILATLDGDGRLEGLPFMPEMVSLIGSVRMVRRRAVQTCVEGHGLRGMERTVLLDAPRCDGSAHDGCQRGCLPFFKEAWLAPIDAPVSIDATREAAARQRLMQADTRDGERYLCQSTALAGATLPPPGGRLRLLLNDLRGGELRPLRFVEILARSVSRRVLVALGKREFGALAGTDGKTQVRLELRPGERVRIKPPRQIAQTLDQGGRNRGMTFEPEMTGYAGGVYTVASRVERIVHEETGKMVKLKATVTLDGLDCQGRCALNCPRANPLYWREAWLERVQAPPSD